MHLHIKLLSIYYIGTWLMLLEGRKSGSFWDIIHPIILFFRRVWQSEQQKSENYISYVSY